MANPPTRHHTHHLTVEPPAPPPGYLVVRDHTGVRLVPKGDMSEAPSSIDVPPSPYVVQAPQLAQTTTVVTGSHLERARSFTHSTIPLATLAGVLGVIAAVAGAGAPLLSLAVLAWFFGAFTVAWVVAWVAHLLVSPDGNALVGQLLLYRLLRFEQRERYRRYRREER